MSKKRLVEKVNGVKVRYHRCSCCGNKAVWMYAPGSSGRIFYCDDCVPRGCSCNVDCIDEEYHRGDLKNNGDRKFLYWDKGCGIDDLNEETAFTEYDKEKVYYFEELDEKGRRAPCCEFWYDKDGFELMIPIIAIMKNDLINAINIVEKRNYLGSSDIKWKELKKWINNKEEEFFNYHTIFDEIKDWLYSNHSSTHIFIEKFYKGYCNSLRNICREKKKQFVDYKTDIF